MKKILFSVICIIISTAFLSCGSVSKNDKMNLSSDLNSTKAVEELNKAQEELAECYEQYYFDNDKTLAMQIGEYKVYKPEFEYRVKSQRILSDLSEEQAREKVKDSLIRIYTTKMICKNQNINISEKELNDNIEEQKEMAKELAKDDKEKQKSMFYYLKNISIDQYYEKEKDNQELFLLQGRLQEKLSKKYGEKQEEEKYNELIEQQKNSIKIKTFF